MKGNRAGPRSRLGLLSVTVASAALLAVSAAGCAKRRSPYAPDQQAQVDALDSGGSLEATTATERLVLSRLGELSPNAPQQVQGVLVTAGVPYSAASGRLCRSVIISQKRGPEVARKLACSAGKGWFFVPEVFAPR